MLVIYFLISILGALSSALFIMPKIFLIVPLFLYRHPKIALALTFYLVVNIVSGPQITDGQYEFVGRVVQAKGNLSVVYGKVYLRKWQKLRKAVGIYKKIPLGWIVYYNGKFLKGNGYPKIILDKEKILTSPYPVSLFSKIYERAEKFRNYSSTINPVYPGLYGGKIASEIFSESGLYHYFSISGAHVSIMYSFSLFFVSSILYHKRLKKLLALILPTFFVIGTGLNLPSIRALIFLYFAIFIEILEFKFDVLEILSFVGIVLIFFEPDIVYSLSFYMTFFATFGVLSVQNKYLSPLGGFLGSAPYLALFSNVNPFSILGTLIVMIPVQITLYVLTFAFIFYQLGLNAMSLLILKAGEPFVIFLEGVSYILSKFPKIPGNIFTYFLLSGFFLLFLAHFGQIPYIFKSKFSKTNP
ncbi:ComEC/Rec2 family competence protein [Thermosipho ferrireducens]|uniref:ComEC/Rec2 family competence protein n=1 Tax=Thermosipho ferrireducens TaxID=2571116 RepID=A0ABX7S725_9BACT|nr:ComEC/Rec2 family competence protein [Thermosipho ferrireducens]QTA37412.1 ComEC/Rec2 family competence protein [Thermosipho ferrireducens]